MDRSPRTTHGRHPNPGGGRAFTLVELPAVSSDKRAAFTLVELLVVIGIVAVLIGLLFPALRKARESAQTASCLANLHQIGVAINAYAVQSRGKIPFGPKAPPFTSATNFYPSTGTPTSLISLTSGDPVGLGLLLREHLAACPQVLFCPSADQPENADEELAKVGKAQAQCGYYYRHGSATEMFEDPSAPLPPARFIQLARLGNNRNGKPIRALVIDTEFQCPPGFAAFGIVPRTHHRLRAASVLFADGHASHLSNDKGRFNVDMNDPSLILRAFEKILGVLEAADEEQ
jgi:prepilin-type N-terminal cleavage/methylation domain-containing protein/prepilin-type processing-associated H-X9-DG protein